MLIVHICALHRTTPHDTLGQALCKKHEMYGCYVFETRHGAARTRCSIYDLWISPAWSNGLVRMSNCRPRHIPYAQAACGYALANRGHDTTAVPANIQHTVRYTELSPTRFKDFWRE